MKNALLMAEAVVVVCPECKEPIGAPSAGGRGSHMWTRSDFEVSRPVVECPNCNKLVRVVPKKKVDFN